MKPRRQQVAITIRSDRAAQRLAVLTRTGRSQAEVIEDALERVPVPIDEDRARGAFLNEIREIGRRARANGPIPSMEEFDAATYDERGLPR
jgi:antitoxin VapB